MKLILGSSSKYRKELLEKAGYVFDVMSPNVDEKNIKTDDLYERPLVLAHRKADALIGKVEEASIIITSDVIVVCEGKLYEKPESEEGARQLLKRYSGGLVPEAVCAVVVVNTQTGERHDGVDKSKVFFKPFSDDFIEFLIREGDMLSRAGGFSIQLMKQYVERIEGNHNGIIGLPIQLLESLLKKAGYKYTEAYTEAMPP
ncbi:septum formation protein Maf [Candidatus Nomurabacteria bacterium RIFCSPLOWO2_01_FULL_39_18]|uniref:Nucleoside triphosphate pyrophosphatase n=1 Tax=Candidatus Nomurabacteria bacterium RIFCSPHIGHO2_01_FULL_40_24b TaxID=1801739 RepID=A0A1F6V9E6_9BACT|nr:MAG: septum formation protein Maf [Candidatus Nomurabacteria bacterium RIFCSPHIGHO2_01_FULL_40_24b]OGI90622.1 MAG: septum formation protein Maf [Candidatus Nomurabacteria bacterium RIFCSPLOWO2_01_FULL_39_18]